MEYDELAEYTEKPAPPPKQPRGCFFYGCLISAILLVVGILAITATVYFGYRYLINTAKEYTETQPMALPPVVMPEAQRQELRKRIETFHKALEEKKAAEPIVLTADDVNAWIDDQPQWKGKARIAIKGEEITGKISIPLSDLKIAELANRYLNGSATLRVALLNGILDVRADSIEVRGKPLPEAFAQSLLGKNLAEKSMDDPKTREALDKLESIVVKNDTIILTPKAAKGQEPPPTPPKDESEAKKPEAEKPEAAKASDEEKPAPEKDEEKPAPAKEPEAPKPEATAEPKTP
jgi:hypothetical protein